MSEKTVFDRLEEKAKAAKEKIDAMKEPKPSWQKKKKSHNKGNDYYIQDYVMHSPHGRG